MTGAHRLGPLGLLARWCAGHVRLVIVGWVALLLLGVGIGGQTFDRLSAARGDPEAESVRGAAMLREQTGGGDRLTVLAEGADALSAGVQQVRDTSGVRDVLIAYPGVVFVDLVPEADVEAVVAAIRAALGPGTRVGGGPMVERETNDQIRRDLIRSELVVMPVVAVLLVLVFGGLLATLLPLVAGVVTVGGALLITFAMSLAGPVSSEVPNILSVLGLGLAIDYGLLMSGRFREELFAGAAVPDAVVRTARTAGRTIAYSALTVTVSLAGLLAFDEPSLRSMAGAAIAAVLVALLANLTLIPALLALLGHRLTRTHRLLRRFAEPPPADGFFSRTTRRVQRRPLLVGGLVVAFLVCAGLPFAHARYADAPPAALPAHFESRQVDEVLAARYPALLTPDIMVVGVTSPGDPAVAAYLRRLRTAAPAAQLQPGSAVFTMVSRGEDAEDLVRWLRANRPPFPAYLTGPAAALVDLQDTIRAGLPLAIAIIVAATGVLLFLMTGSVVIPVKAILMNALSLSAAFGALVWIFQDGHLSGPLGFTPTGSLEIWIPVLAFTFGFGLSMDYEVFLVARIKELHDAGLSTAEAVAQGLQRSGRVITSAAAVIVVVFAGFAGGDLLPVKQMGVAMALIVLVDALLVRTLLLPATMTLLGHRNWWAPAWLAHASPRPEIRSLAGASR